METIVILGADEGGTRGSTSNKQNFKKVLLKNLRT